MTLGGPSCKIRSVSSQSCGPDERFPNRMFSLPDCTQGWIRTEHHKHFGRATSIIDWYHADEHVCDCWTRKLLDDLKGPRKKYRTAKRGAIDTLIRYVSSNGEEMRYDVFRAKGYDICSGAVEGAC